jgi:hypothetical protein
MAKTKLPPKAAPELAPKAEKRVFGTKTAMEEMHRANHAQAPEEQVTLSRAEFELLLERLAALEASGANPGLKTEE